MSANVTRKSIIMALTEEGGVGPRMFQQLLLHLGTPEDLLKASYPDFEDIPRFGEKNIDRMMRSLDNIEEYSSRLSEYGDVGINVVTCLDEDYPAGLREIDDPPPLIYCKGDRDAWSVEYVALVGTTKATQPGIRAAVDLAKELIQCGYGVLSGLAAGIDSAAHLSAISENGRTIAVLGCGILNIYPRENESLAENITGSGLLISEHYPFKKVTKPALVLRNRLISALSNAVVVVQAGSRTKGELRTAMYAVKQARPLFYVNPDGSLDNETIAGIPGVIINGGGAVDEIIKYIV